MAVAISPDSRYIVTGTQVWNYHTSSKLHVLDGEYGRIKSLSITSDSKWILGGFEDSAACIWDLTTGKLLSKLTEKIPPQCVANHPYSRLLANYEYESFEEYWNEIVTDSGRWTNLSKCGARRMAN